MDADIYVSHSFSGNLEVFQELVLDIRVYVHLVCVCVFPYVCGLLSDEAARPLGGSHKLSSLRSHRCLNKMPLFSLFLF